jgi:hypothetical protein
MMLIIFYKMGDHPREFLGHRISKTMPADIDYLLKFMAGSFVKVFIIDVTCMTSTAFKT